MATYHLQREVSKKWQELSEHFKSSMALIPAAVWIIQLSILWSYLDVVFLMLAETVSQNDIIPGTHGQSAICLITYSPVRIFPK